MKPSIRFAATLTLLLAVSAAGTACLGKNAKCDTYAVVKVKVAAAGNGVEKAEKAAAESKRSPRKENNLTCAKSSILINASPEIVWRTVHEERECAPDLAYSHIISQAENEMQIEQKFKFLSGGAKCLMHQKEIPNERIDYKLIKSDKLKELKGSWVLTPSSSGEETTLELSTAIDYGFFFPRSLGSALAGKALERRLAHVKKMAEEHRQELQVKGRVISASQVPVTK